MSEAAKAGTVPVPPAVEGDFYDLAALLEEEDRLLLKRVRTFMEEHVAPIINVYWGKAEFPFEVLPAMAELGIAGLAYSRLRLPRPQLPGRWVRGDGTGPHRPVDGHVHGRPRRPGHGNDLPVRLRGAEGSSGSRRWPAWRRSAPSA